LARDFRALAIEMGGVLIKLGQFLSARVDVLPPEITEELLDLQDEVPPVPPEAMDRVLHQELADNFDAFAEIEWTPLAAASLGQAYRAWLQPTDEEAEAGLRRGAPIVLKVQRPNIRAIVQTDLAALRVVAQWVVRYRPIGRRADVPALMEEFAVTLWEELDYVAEIDNAERFRDMYAGDERVYIPRVYREFCTPSLIVLENVESHKITDIDALKADGIDTVETADRLLDVYFHQIFREGFFHADPHPGNLFIRPREDLPWDPDSGEPRPYQLIFVDFGMVGHVSQILGDNLKTVLISVSQRDARRLTEAYQRLGFFLPSADLERINQAQEQLLDQIWGRNLLDLARPDPREIAELGQQFRDILFDFPFQVPQDFIYLGRALGILSGIASLLDPQVNPWYQVERYGRELISAREAQQFSREALLGWIRPIAALPGQLQRLVAAAEAGKLRVETATDRATLQRMERIERQLARVQWSILAAAGAVSGTLLFLQRRRERDDPPTME
jgi:predicted unusual protein kinase regulating ubiquinone biosynthesis (AarF/ABC1/UbiB family)